MIDKYICLLVELANTEINEPSALKTPTHNAAKKSIKKSSSAINLKKLKLFDKMKYKLPDSGEIKILEKVHYSTCTASTILFILRLA